MTPFLQIAYQNIPTPFTFGSIVSSVIYAQFQFSGTFF
jgi:hypothetical protein